MRIRFVSFSRDRKKNGMAPIYMEARLQVNGKREQERINTGVEAPPEAWDQRRQRIVSSNKTLNGLNLRLQTWKAKATDIETNYFLNESTLTPALLKEELLNEGARYSFALFMRSEIKKLENKNAQSGSTSDSERESLNRVLRFRDEVLFSDLTPAWLEDFEATMKREKFSVSTTHKTIKHLRKYVKRAIRQGIRVVDPFDAYSLPSVPETKIVWLTIEEITRLENLYFSGALGSVARNALQCFLISCWTGIRFSDYDKVKHENLHGNMLKFLPKKTERYGRYVTVPITERCRKLMDGEDGLLWGLHSDQVHNRELKVIARMVGIKKKLTTHVARHSFASNWVLSGRNIVALQRILGHAKLQDTMIYVHLHARDLDNEMIGFAKWAEGS